MNLIECFKKNDMYLPDYTAQVSIIDLMNIIYGYCGYSQNSKCENQIVKQYVKNRKHIVFILSDGMGSNLIDSLSNNMLLKKNKVLDLQTVCPTTTGCVLSSIATAKYPAVHGMIGWYNYLREKGINYYTLLFKDRISGKNLKELGIKSSNIYQYESIMNYLSRKTVALFPEKIVDSEFSQFMLERNRIGYESIEDVFKKLNNYIQQNLDTPTFSYVYLPYVDNISHYNGVYSDNVKNVIEKLENEIIKLKANKIEDLEIIITADHGQIDVNKEIVMDFEKYNHYFYALPGIDFGTATYYVKDNQKTEFLKNFRKDFENEMYVFNTEEFIKSKLFGYDVISEYMKSNLGDFISFCRKGVYFVNTIENEEDYIGKIKGSHSGFSKEEIMIPLIVIN